MMLEITYNYTDKTIIVASDKGDDKTYKDAASYLADWPDRETDCDAIGWIKPHNGGELE